MRPDRIVVGDIRRKKEAEVLFEAMHTGHSVYATLHANDARETVVRLTNPPIAIPKMLLPAVSLILVQSRNRRTGKRRSFQIAEVTHEGDARVLYQHDVKTDTFIQVNEWGRLMETLELYTGLSPEALKKDIEHKKQLLNYLVQNNINDVDKLGLFFSRYYTGRLDMNIGRKNEIAKPV
jgi:flagellar protein FlaI